MLIDVIVLASKRLLEGYLLLEVSVIFDYLCTDIWELFLLPILDDPGVFLHDLVVHDSLESFKVQIILSHGRNRLSRL